MIGSLLVAVAIVALAIVAVTARLGPTPIAELETREERFEIAQERREQRLEAKSERLEEARE